MDLSALKFDGQGLIPVIAQDAKTGKILMLAWANAEALQESERTKRGTYFSRSRQKLWRKGEESGNIQEIKDILLDCDGDAIIYKVIQKGGVACHTGHRSCFYKTLVDGHWVENEAPIKDPAQMYGHKTKE